MSKCLLRKASALEYTSFSEILENVVRREMGDSLKDCIYLLFCEPGPRLQFLSDQEIISM